ncbi:MAG: 4Fe-4S binding protein [Verrucomicrobia bacterium]|nr:4Fe-4S binding protein [Verrucomicrobiota bacterium]
MEHQKAEIERRIESIESGKAPGPRRPKPIVSAERCTGCGICLDICPTEAIVVVNGTATISDDCIGCGVCVAECPNGALSLA